jgi:hypothetical protein
MEIGMIATERDKNAAMMARNSRKAGPLLTDEHVPRRQGRDKSRAAPGA